MAAEQRMAMTGDIGQRLLDENANGVDVVVGVIAGVGALAEPVRAAVDLQIPGDAVERLARLRRNFGGDAAGWNAPQRCALALVHARRADQAKRRALGQMR
jgi:hypothetical protein